LYSMVLDWPARRNVPADNKVARKVVTYGARLMGCHRESNRDRSRQHNDDPFWSLPLQYRPMAPQGPVIDLLNTLMNRLLANS
ncbi:hypothetical protein AnigIFM63309_000193, partial [Aspergillus niger]